MAPAAEKLVGLLLAGGASSRLGRDKASLVLPGRSFSLAENARRILEAAGLPVIVAARDLARAEFLLPGCRAVADGPGRGPAAALLGAHAAFPEATLVALGCDMPLVPPDLLRLLAEVAGDWVVPAWSEKSLEPLAALYRPAALEALARRVAAGRFDLRGLEGEAGLVVTHLGHERIAEFGDPAAIFRNINEPRDLEAFAAVRQPPCRPD